MFPSLPEFASDQTDGIAFAGQMTNGNECSRPMSSFSCKPQIQRVIWGGLFTLRLLRANWCTRTTTKRHWVSSTILQLLNYAMFDCSKSVPSTRGQGKSPCMSHARYGHRECETRRAVRGGGCICAGPTSNMSGGEAPISRPHHLEYKWPT